MRCGICEKWNVTDKCSEKLGVHPLDEAGCPKLLVGIHPVLILMRLGVQSCCAQGQGSGPLSGSASTLTTMLAWL